MRGLAADATTPAVPLAQALQATLDETLAGLPVPKMMSYQLSDGATTVNASATATYQGVKYPYGGIQLEVQSKTGSVWIAGGWSGTQPVVRH